MFPIVYIPFVNTKIFKHGAITWEWGVAASAVVLYVGAIEAWKCVKRRTGMWSGGRKMVGREDEEARAGLGVRREK
jgi:Na+-exporting ATPase